MSVLTPVIDYLELSTKRIYLLPGTREYHPVTDIYTEIRNIRRTDESMRVFDIPVSAFGAVPKGGGKYTARYTQFNNGWKIVPEAVSHDLLVTGEQITDDGQSGKACMDLDALPTGVNIFIQYEPPASELVKAEDELIAIQRMAFDEVITVNVESGSSGTEWPIGTLGTPVNNLEDALLISDINDIFTLSILVDTLVDSGGDYRGMTFIGASKTKTEITVSDAAQVDNCEFYDAHIKGILDGDSTLKGCVIDDLNYVTGFIEECVLDAGTVLLGSGATAHFLDCWSGVPGTGTPTIDMGGSGQSLAMRNYNGGIAIINKTGPESVSLDINSGQVKIDLDTVTNGTIVIRGIGKVIDLNTGENIPTGTYGDLYILNEAINRENISAAVWDEPIKDHLQSGSTGLSVGIAQFNSQVTINADTGVSGTEFPIGTERVPVSNIQDAVTIAELRGLKTLKFTSDFYIDNTIYIVGYTLEGNGESITTLTCQPGAIMAYCTFKNATVTGLAIGTIGYESCLIEDFGSASPQVIENTVVVDRCIFKGSVTLPALFQGKFYVLDCYGMPTDAGAPPILDMGGGAFDIEMRNYSGYVDLRNSTNATDIRMMFNSGGVILDSTCTAGNFLLSGVGTLQDDSTSVTSMDTSSLINEDIIAESVWDEPIANHLQSGSTGLSVGIQQFGGTVTIDVVNGSSGTAFPIGTSGIPVNNIPDAIAIANNNGLNAFTVKGEMTASGGPFAGYTVYGENTQDTIINCVDLDCQGVTFEKCTVTGNFINDSYITTRECVVTDATDIEILAYSTSFGGAVRLIKSVGGKSVFYDCYDNVPGIGVPDIQLNTCDELGIWNFNGGIRLSTITTPGTIISCMIAQGRLWVDETCVEGDIIVKGMADLRGETAGTTIDQDGLITGDKIAEFVLNADITEHQIHDTVGFVFMQLSYADRIFIDVNSGNSGTDYPVGTEEHPVDNVGDALVLMSKYSCSILHPHSAVTFESNHILDHYIIQGHGDLMTVNSASTNFTRFQNVRITGTMNGKCNFDVCQLSNISGMYGRAESCVLAGTLTMANGKTQIMDKCTAVDLVGPIFDLDGGATLVTTAQSGRVTATNLTTGTLGIGGDFCQVVLDATCTGGMAAIGTKGTFINNSTGTYVPLENTLNLASIAEGVWEYER